MITLEQLQDICPAAPAGRLGRLIDDLNESMDRFEIDITPARMQAFIAQLAHESGQFRYMKELWGPTPAQARYEGRIDLGNTEPGDGFKFRGRGLIQITGRANYKTCGTALGIDLIAQPELLEAPRYACRSAAWFWYSMGLNELADAGDFKKITRRINGGLNGYAERCAFLAAAEQAIA